MWKEDRTSLGNGDLEMVGSTAGTVLSDDYDDGYEGDEYEGQGFSMGGNTRKGGYTSQTGHSSGGVRGKCYCCALLFIAGVLAMAYVFVTDFQLLQFGGGNSDNSDEKEHATVSEESVIHNDNYEIVLQVPVDTVEGDLVMYQHKKTKTPVMTIIPYDTSQDSVFSISYRTKPSNSHGAPHVLEHSVLSGSKKYPVKDPFTQVLKGSLNTFVNAMTFDDMTAYLCASRNDVDMRNLMSVYMDAVFQPLVITEEGKWIFRQEGWRVEMNETGEPEFNGVVLSEMKGATSNPDEILSEYSKALIFPNTTYRFNSGGEPKVIPNLNQRELTEFYKTFYHPSNAQVFMYGTKRSAENCLQQLDEYLRAHEPRPEIRVQSKIELQPMLDLEPKKQRLPYAAEADDDSHYIMMSWMISADGAMDDDFQREFRFAYKILDKLLMNEKFGVLYQVLQNSGLGGSIDGGVEQTYQQWTFDVQMANVNASNFPVVEELIRTTLEKVAFQGFAREDIESAMNTVEFTNRDISSYTFPRGILLWMNLMSTWKFDLDPMTGFLSFERDWKELKEKVSKHGSDFFKKIVLDNLVYNQHSVVIELYPDPNLAQKNAEEEQARLVKLRQSQSFPALLDEADNLADKQVAEDPPELLATIPSVTVQDLAKEGYEPPILIYEDREGSGVTVLLHELESSFGIVYADFGVDISMLEFDDIVLIPLLARLMVDAGTKKYSDVQISREVGSNTAGIDEEILMSAILPHNVTTRYRVPDGDHFHSKLFLRGAATKDKGKKLLELLSQIMFEAKLDSQERALGILRESISEKERRLTAGSTFFVSTRLHARYNPFKFVEETYSGVSCIPQLRALLQTAENDWSSLLARLNKMKEAILKGSRNGMVLNLTGEKAVLRQVAPRVSHFLANQLPERSQETPLPNFATEPHPWVPKARQLMATESPKRNEGLVGTAQVNFVGSGGPFYVPFAEVPGGTAVVTQYIEYNNFFPQIRERRGAYGAFAISDKWTGILMFMSYRDPNLAETLQVYREVPIYLKDQIDDPGTSNALINSAIIGTIGTLDGSAPQPNAAGWLSLMQWLQGSTPKLRQTWREEIMATSSKDLLDYAHRMKSSWEHTLCIAGPKTALEMEKGLNLTLIDLL